MAVYFADTSAWVKLFIRETGSDKMIALAQANDLAFADIALVELHSAIRRKQLQRLLSPVEADQLLDRAEDDFRDRRTVPLSAEVMLQATKCIATRALHHRTLRAYDAVQLASALWLSERITLAGIICADGDLADASRQFGLEVVDPAGG